jgi:hypothetical protein
MIAEPINSSGDGGIGGLVARRGGLEDAVLAKHVTWIGAIALIHVTSRWFADPQSWILVGNRTIIAVATV